MKQSTRKFLMDYSIPEEIANAITHGIGVLLSIAALVILIVKAVREGTAWHVTSYTIFGVSMVLLYLMSTLYHSLPWAGARNVFARLDHATIFVLIAGTYTPYTLTVLRGPWGWVIFGLVWGIAILGVVLKAIYLDKYHTASTWIYLAMGWIILIAGPNLFRLLPHKSLVYLIIGGILYSVGFIFYRMKRVAWTHPIWHLFVMAGTLFHFFSVLYLTS
ncbi:PAQR family membrane homeostasis protein TrhA [Fidelibacter multiformis]|jgi:hemolysin III|uniref:PAQR family membrane homeostasis protein TrhA n=1 Tax=Fidelibacter multiformis TaxID=3377529 RepID=UPI0037DDA5A5